ncbi:YitT family protein [Paenibacillus caui]|uniref:YitT family protein n=1 Tax=Paenibacillus caui TaxID=2873927 RepID=UPI001CA862E9|nr:YitT family protein [Paenibacillus caui]
MRKEKTAFGVGQILMILFGAFLLAFTYYHINFQNHLAEGGFVGLALLGKYLFNLPPALTNLLLDIPVLMLALFMKNRRFIWSGLLGFTSFSVMYEACERFSPFHFDFQHNLLPVALISGILTGIGAGLVLRAGGVSGGDDLLALFISKWTGIKLGTVFILLDGLVLLLSLVYLPLMETLFTILAVSIAGKIITWMVSYQKKSKPAVTISYVAKKKTARA